MCGMKQEIEALRADLEEERELSKKKDARSLRAQRGRFVSCCDMVPPPTLAVLYFEYSLIDE